jgi:hypothetical protein
VSCAVCTPFLGQSTQIWCWAIKLIKIALNVFKEFGFTFFPNSWSWCWHFLNIRLLALYYGGLGVMLSSAVFLFLHLHIWFLWFCRLLCKHVPLLCVLSNFCTISKRSTVYFCSLSQERSRGEFYTSHQVTKKFLCTHSTILPKGSDTQILIALLVNWTLNHVKWKRFVVSFIIWGRTVWGKVFISCLLFMLLS